MWRRSIQSPTGLRRWHSFLLALLSVLFVTQPLQLFNPQRVRAHGFSTPVQVGVSFSPRRAAALGLDYQSAFQQLEAMHFKVIRLSTYWDEIDQSGYGEMDWLMQEARRSHQPVVMSVGMKGLGWPEFFIPSSVMPRGGISGGQDVATDEGLQAAALQFVDQTVLRYRDNPALIAWQVENEPFNRAGPERWFIDKDFLDQEATVVRTLDRRPLIVTAFSHFNLLFDQASDRNGFSLADLLGFQTSGAEGDTLSVLHRGDILGLDVYTAIGYQFLGQDHLSRASADWPDRLASVRAQALQQGKRAWVTEAQAEPWEASSATFTDPLSTSPAAIRELFNNLKDDGYSTVLLWGSEYWLWRAENGDSRWVDTVRGILQGESRAPNFALVA